MHWKASADMDWNKFLHGAIAEEDIDLVRQALLEGADPNEIGDDGVWYHRHMSLTLSKEQAADWEARMVQSRRRRRTPIVPGSRRPACRAAPRP